LFAFYEWCIISYLWCISKKFYIRYRKYWHLVQDKTEKNRIWFRFFDIWCTILQMVPFYIWCRNTRYKLKKSIRQYTKKQNHTHFTRDETIWRYIDTVSIRWLTIRIVAQRDISRYYLDINFVIRRSRHVVFIFCIWWVFRIHSRDIFSVGVVV